MRNHKQHIICLAFSFLLSLQSKSSIWLRDPEQATQEALKSGKLILVDFWAVWCRPCQAMDRDLWADPDVELMQHKFINLKLDLSTYREFIKKYHIRHIPLVMFMDADGLELFKIEPPIGKQNILFDISMFPADVSVIYNSTKRVKENPNNPFLLCELGEAYQLVSNSSSGIIQNHFRDESNQVFKKILKMDDVNSCLYGKVYLHQLMNKTLMNENKKVLDELNRFIKGFSICESNQAYCLFLMALNYLKTDQMEFAKARYAELKKSPAAGLYLKTLEPFFPD